jgi:hypothetical protein
VGDFFECPKPQSENEQNIKFDFTHSCNIFGKTIPDVKIKIEQVLSGLIWRTSPKCRKRAVGEFCMGRVRQCPYKTSFLNKKIKLSNSREFCIHW